MRLVDFKRFDLKACSCEACLRLGKQGEAMDTKGPSKDAFA